MRAATISCFQRSIAEQNLTEKKYPFNILKDREFEKSRTVLVAKRNLFSTSRYSGSPFNSINRKCV